MKYRWFYIFFECKDRRGRTATGNIKIRWHYKIKGNDLKEIAKQIERQTGMYDLVITNFKEI